MEKKLHVNLERLNEIAVPESEEEKAIRLDRQQNRGMYRHSLNVALLIRKTMRERNIGKEEFMELMGLSLTVAESYLSGKRNFTLKEIADIENKLNINIFKEEKL